MNVYYFFMDITLKPFFFFLNSIISSSFLSSCFFLASLLLLHPSRKRGTLQMYCKNERTMCVILHEEWKKKRKVLEKERKGINEKVIVVNIYYQTI
jgi:hypothetical protein